MSRRRYTIPALVLLLLTIVAAKLLLTAVEDPPNAPGVAMYERFRGWPWVCSRSINSKIIDTSSWWGWQPAGFSYPLLLADVATLFLMLAIAALLLRRRMRRHGRWL